MTLNELLQVIADELDAPVRLRGEERVFEPTTNCYCCTCGESGWDPACRNHGAHGVRPCERHGSPGDLPCGCGCEEGEST